jgi:hypothetical protein
MIKYGQMHCKTLVTKVDQYGNVQEPLMLLGYMYYDALEVYLQIGQYTKDPSWQSCAKAAVGVWRDYYIIPNTGKVAGYWNFTTGLTMDYLMNGDVNSKTAELMLAHNAAYTLDATPLEWTATPFASREVAYVIRSYLNAEKLGEARRPRLMDLVKQVFGQIDQWFISKSYRCDARCVPFGIPEGVYYVQPFMVGLSMEALIMYYEATKDPQVLPAVKTSLDWLWANAWVPADGAFWYDNYVTDPKLPFPAKAGSPDLNLLIAPAYAWYYQMTGDTTYRDRGDQVFAGGVNGAFIASAKQFNQNYSYGFQYVSRRLLGEGGTPPVSIPLAPAVLSQPAAPQAQAIVQPTPQAAVSAPVVAPQAPASAPASIEQPSSPSSPEKPKRKTYWRFLFGK